MSKHPTLLIVCAYAALATWLSLVIPLGEAADEVSHRAYAHELAANHRLPSAGTAASGEMYQPPLYYAMLAGLETLAPAGELAVYANPDASLAPGSPPNLLLHTRSEAWPPSPGARTWHLLRLVSVLLGAITVWATSRLAGAIFPDRPHLAWGSAAFIAFLPGFLFLSAALNNDNLIVAIATVTLWQLVRLLQRPVCVRHALLVGVLLGLAVLAKMSGIALWGAAALAFAWRARRDGRRSLAAGAGCLALAALICAPWLLHNMRAGIDVFGWARVLDSVPRSAPMTVDDWRYYVSGLYTSFWGRFGGATHLRLPAPVYLAAALVPLLSALGLLRAGSAWLRRREWTFAPQALAFLAIFGAAIVAAHVRFALALEGADLARHLFPALAPLALFLVLGVSRLARRPGEPVAALAAALLALAVGSAALVTTTFTPHSLRAADLPPLPRSAQADFGDEIRVTGFALEVTTAAEGPALAVTIHWQALAAPGHVYWLMLRVVGPQGQEITHDGVPALGWPTTDRWRTGDVYASRHIVALPASSPAGSYRVEVGLHHMGAWQWLPVQGRDLLALGEVEVKP